MSTILAYGIPVFILAAIGIGWLISPLLRPTRLTRVLAEDALDRKLRAATGDDWAALADAITDDEGRAL